MMLAEVDNSTLGLFVQAATAILMLIVVGMQVLRGASGKDGQRQIEPTEFHSIKSELGSQTETLNKINREVGEVKTRVDALATDVGGFHTRAGGISRELAATTARVEDLIRREGK